MNTVTVHLTRDTERALRDKASRSGVSLETYLEQLAEREARNGTVPTLPHPASFDELSAPVREAFRQSGMTDAELTGLVEEAREEVWQERQREKRP
jgi:hypothetical protein